MAMLDLAPLFRTAIGFERFARLVDAAQEASASSGGYPPYNIEKTGEDSYRLSLAVAGFGPEDIEITAQEGVLSVKGRASGGDDGRRWLYRGIAGRSFERRFALADYVQVEEARLEHGLLHVGLRRVVPDSLKPRRVPIAGLAGPRLAAPAGGDEAQAAA